MSFPCGVTTDKDVDTGYVDHQALNGIDAEAQNDCKFYLPIREPETNKIDSAEAVHGMSVNLQLVGRKLEEESVLAMTNMILKAIVPKNETKR